MNGVQAGLLAVCTACSRPVEGIIYGPEAERDGVRGYRPFAHSHERRRHHWPNRVHMVLSHAHMAAERRN